MFDASKIKNQKVLEFIQDRIDLLQPQDIVLIDGSEEIYKAFSMLVDDANEYAKMSHAQNPYGDGTASIQIADYLEKNL